MREISPDELRELAARFGVELTEYEASPVAERVSEMVDGVDDVFDLSFPDGTDLDDRSWWRPDDDPHNAVSAACTVPPVDGHSGLLSGTTVGAKDIIAVGGVPMECASAVMRGYVPARDATVVRRLREAGASVVAKTNLDEFAASPWAESVSGPITNPHDSDRIAGGSSGGSAVAVATGVSDVALGTDTGGSIRIPSSFCGIVGLKPTHGLVSLDGVVENTYTQDHVGPMTRTVDDAARVLEAIAGPDDRDPASLQAAGRESYRVGGYVDALSNAPAMGELTVGVVRDGFGEGIDEAVEATARSSVDALEDAGATVEEVSIDGYEYVSGVKNAVSFTELAAHWRDSGVPVRRGGSVDDGYQAALGSRSAAKSGELGEYYKCKLLAGALLLDRHDGRHYTRAQAAREVLREAVVEALAGVDVLVMPTMPMVAPRIEDGEDPGYAYGRNTRLADVTRQPAITLPDGTVDGLPTGLQLMADEFEERTLLAAASSVYDVVGDG
jgi:amidase/aspartyl-tRNA(Asn)/glutamyl-tRNA(Gln) amidotransferase subunit A